MKEVSDPRWLRVGDDPDDELSEESRLTLLEMHEKATRAFEGLVDVELQADHIGMAEIKRHASAVSAAAEQVVVEIEQAADYWEVNL